MELLYFILGSIFMVIGASFMQNFADVIDSFSLLIIYKNAIKIWNYKKEMGITNEEEEELNLKIPMGFHTLVIGTEIDTIPEELEEE